MKECDQLKVAIFPKDQRVEVWTRVPYCGGKYGQSINNIQRFIYNEDHPFMLLIVMLERPIDGFIFWGIHVGAYRQPGDSPNEWKARMQPIAGNKFIPEIEYEIVTTEEV